MLEPTKDQFSLVAHVQPPSVRILSFEPVATAVAEFEAVFFGDSRTEIFGRAVARAAQSGRT